MAGDEAALHESGCDKFVLSFKVAADTAGEVDVDLSPDRLVLRDREGARCLELPCKVVPEVCRVRFSAKRHEVALELRRADGSKDPGEAAAEAVEADGSQREGAASPAAAIASVAVEGGAVTGRAATSICVEANTLAALLRSPRPPGRGLQVCGSALPPALAREAREGLAALPEEAWEAATTTSQPLSGQNSPISMRFRRLGKHMGLEALECRISEALTLQLGPGPCERILLNFSKYQQGDYLDSHPDVPSGSRGHERRDAFVWHLSEDWEEGDGGLFIDEEAEGGPHAIVPRFNALVTFPVPRWHSVTKVASRSGQRARFAAYGWVVAPSIEQLHDGEALEELLKSAGSRAVVVACVREPLRPEAEAFISCFAGLPFERCGRHTMGDACAFAASAEPAVARWLGVAEAPEAAVVLTGRSPADRQALIDRERLRSCTSLRQFVEDVRNRRSPCADLDITDAALMEDLCSSPAVKVFVIVPDASRTPQLASVLSRWATALQPRLRFFMVEPCTSMPLLADYGLTVADVPTAVAWDSQGALGSARLLDHARGLELPLLRQWLGCVAEAAGVARPDLAL